MIKNLLIFGGIQGFIFTIAILRMASPKNRKANIFFSLLIGIVSVFMLVSSQSNFIWAESPKLGLLTYILIYTYCPLFYLFTEAHHVQEFRFERKHLILTLPTIIFFLGWARYAFMSTEEFDTIFNSRSYYDLLIIDSIAISLNIYFVWMSWRLAIQRVKKEESPFARPQAFKMLAIGLMLANVLWIFMVLSSLGIQIPFIRQDANLLYISMSLLIFLFGYVLVLRPEYFSVPAFIRAVRYQNVNMDASSKEDLQNKITRILEETKPYKNPDFSLSDLADLIHVDKVKVSYTINKVMETNFTSLVNKYRVNEFILLSESNDYKNYSILGIATEAGFSSKSTFYKAFKEIKGQTPKEYFKDERQEDLKSA